MSNPFNNGTIVGNAARAPKLFEHANGSATVKLSVYARNTFKNKSTGKVESEIVELTGYVQDAKNPGVFGCIGSGDRVAVSYSLKTDVYTDKDGVKHYPLVARIDTVQLIDSKKESAARAARRGGEAANAALAGA
ncbi:single-stranded DNA-binding protein, partial [Corynebacterium sp. HMSC05C01]|uniref:single-stranded DNA-binding protein n=1 Tax=Corynebacterium sp. HMSC05C01 TaxID=1581113 RepID=UPI0008A1D9A5